MENDKTTFLNLFAPFSQFVPHRDSNSWIVTVMDLIRSYSSLHLKAMLTKTAAQCPHTIQASRSVAVKMNQVLPQQYYQQREGKCVLLIQHCVK